MKLHGFMTEEEMDKNGAIPIYFGGGARYLPDMMKTVVEKILTRELPSEATKGIISEMVNAMEPTVTEALGRAEGTQSVTALGLLYFLNQGVTMPPEDGMTALIQVVLNDIKDGKVPDLKVVEHIMFVATMFYFMLAMFFGYDATSRVKRKVEGSQDFLESVLHANRGAVISTFFGDNKALAPEDFAGCVAAMVAVAATGLKETPQQTATRMMSVGLARRPDEPLQ